MKLVFKEKRRLSLSFVCSLFVAFFTYVFVDLVQPIMDHMFQMSPADLPEKTRPVVDILKKLFELTSDDLVKYLPLILVLVIFGKGLFTFLSSFFMRSVGLRIVRKMRNNLFDHLIYQSSDYFDFRSTGELMSRLTSDVDRIQEAVSGSARDIIQESFILFALLVNLFVKDWELALASMVITPLAVILLGVFSFQLKKISKSNQIKMAQIFSLLHETITGNKIVKAFSMEKFEMKKFYEATKQFFKTSLKLAWIGSLASPFMEFIGGIVGAFILVVGTARITQGHISAGDFSAFLTALFLMYAPIKRISRANNVIQQGTACYERVQEILQAQPKIVNAPRAYPLDPIQGNVKFNQVTFSYNRGRFIIQDISFEVQPNEMIALVGLSGSGKTTVINLLARFYDPTSGEILIDGHDIKKVRIDSLRSQIGLVTQEMILFNDSVGNNIAYGLENISEEKIIKAAKTAEAHDFIMKLPQGYDTQIGEGGSILSSGQKQRVSIARALLKDPPILILDEATSALDSESERLIQIALKKVMQNRTTFVIAHRLSTIRNAAKILVIDKGKIAETGTHAELCRNDGIYKKLYDLQFP